MYVNLGVSKVVDSVVMVVVVVVVFLGSESNQNMLSWGVKSGGVVSSEERIGPGL